MTSDDKTAATVKPSLQPSLQPSFFQVPDVATVTTQMIFQSGLSRSNVADLTKKVLLAFIAKYIYDNINKIGGQLFSAKTRLTLSRGQALKGRAKKTMPNSLSNANDMGEVETRSSAAPTGLTAWNKGAVQPRAMPWVGLGRPLRGSEMDSRCLGVPPSRNQNRPRMGRGDRDVARVRGAHT